MRYSLAFFIVACLLACAEEKVCTVTNGVRSCITEAEALALDARPKPKPTPEQIHTQQQATVQGGSETLGVPAVVIPVDKDYPFMDISFTDALQPNRDAQTAAQKEDSMEYLVGRTVRWYGWVDQVYRAQSVDEYHVRMDFRPWQCNEKGTKATNWVSAEIREIDGREWGQTVMNFNLLDMIAVTCEVEEIRGELTPELRNCSEIALIKRTPVKFHTTTPDEDTSCTPNKRHEPWPPEQHVLEGAGFKYPEKWLE